MNNPSGRIELLSPAGNMEAVRAAVCNGADAVYLGAASFGARSSAGFDRETLEEAISFCHLMKRRVYITVNTLIKEKELDEVIRTAGMLRDLHADALIIQDIGLYNAIRDRYPDIRLHLSTQMTLHNRCGAEFAKEIGADRLVLARECDIGTIRSVCGLGIETEVFVHGALCVCVSGQCLFSSSIGSRSGNRGRCAQPCRMDYLLNGKKGAWLSPRDLCLRDRIPELIDAGVSSLKIEGRLKRPEYVAIVTAAYRKAIDSVYEGHFRKADGIEQEELRQIFSRGGFTEGYAFGKEDADIVYKDRVTSEGVVIGTIGRTVKTKNALLAEFVPDKELHNGDYLEIGDQNIIYSGPDALPGSKVLLRMHEKPIQSAQVRRLQDGRQLENAQKTYENCDKLTSCQIPFDAVFRAVPNERMSLSVSDGISSFTVYGDVPEPALKREADRKSIHDSLSKCGGTFFELSSLSVAVDHVYIPVKSINEMRRQALEGLRAQRIRQFERSSIRTDKYENPYRKCRNAPSEKQLFVSTYTPGALKGLKAAGADRIIFMPRDYRGEALDRVLSQYAEEGMYLALPVFCTDGDITSILDKVRKYKLQPAYQNIGQLRFAHEFPGGIALESLPVFNSLSSGFLTNGLCDYATVSCELIQSEIDDLAREGNGRLMLRCYGRTRLMTLSHCPVRTEEKLSSGKKHCTMCEAGCGTDSASFTDMFSASYPLLPVRLNDYCRINLMHSKTTDLSQYLSDILKSGISPQLAFSTESVDEQLEITSVFKKMMDSRISSHLTAYTGHFRQMTD